MQIQKNASVDGLELDGEEVWTKILEVTRG
jgi:hypothetical protein